MLILYDILNLEKLAKDNNLDKDILLTTSLNGDFNDKLALQWLKHFKINSRKSQMRFWRLFILDAYGLYLTYKFYEFA